MLARVVGHVILRATEKQPRSHQLLWRPNTSRFSHGGSSHCTPISSHVTSLWNISSPSYGQDTTPTVECNTLQSLPSRYNLEVSASGDPQALLFHTSSDSIPLFSWVPGPKLPCLYLVPLETQHFQDQWNCFSSLTLSPVNSPIILYPQTSLLPLWFCLLLLSPLKLSSLWQSTLS